LVYEDECVLRYVLRQWHLEYRVILSPDEECISQAWVIYHSNATCTEGDSCPRRSVGQDFIAVVFKGTSSFNFTEWMIDFTMSKIKPHGENLPGMIHEVKPFLPVFPPCSLRRVPVAGLLRAIPMAHLLEGHH
jgi:hypothetical protein